MLIGKRLKCSQFFRLEILDWYILYRHLFIFKNAYPVPSKLYEKHIITLECALLPNYEHFIVFYEYIITVLEMPSKLYGPVEKPNYDKYLSLSNRYSYKYPKCDYDIVTNMYKVLTPVAGRWSWCTTLSAEYVLTSMASVGTVVCGGRSFLPKIVIFYQITLQ